LAYGWRHLLPLLADAGYRVVAPDQRGFGRTTGWVNDYDAPLVSRTRSSHHYDCCA
jgi:pimeloyl-ACP methyl ester carboxylesterase